MMQLNEIEKKILEAILKLNGHAYTKKIAKEVQISPQTVSKYLLALEGKKIVIKDDSQRPHIFWRINEGVE